MLKKENYAIYFLTILSIFLCTFFWDKISLPYSNSEEVLGYYSFFKHNEFNDTLRYVIFITVPLITFFLLFIVLKKDQCLSFNKIFANPAIKIPKSNFYLNFILLFLIIILTIKFFIGDFPDFKLDAFHEGQLLSGAYNFYITNEMWKSTYVISGLFMDILNANLAWFFAGEETIGAYRFYIYFLQFLTSILFLILSFNIAKAFNYEKDEEILLFLILAVISLSLINNATILFRDIPLALFLIFCLSILKSHNKNYTICVLLSFLSIFSLLWSLDRGVYLNATLICFIFILYFKGKNLQIFYIVSGIFVGWLIFYFIIGKEEFLAFITHSFTVLKYMDLEHGIIYPTPFSNEENAVRATKNLLVIIVNGIFVISTLFNKKNSIPKETKLFLGILFVLGFLFYKSGLSRSDGSHMRQALTFQIILFSIFLYYYLLDFYKKNFKNVKFKYFLEKYFIILLTLIFFLQNSIYPNSLKNITNFKERYVNFINLDNNYFLINEEKKILDRLKFLIKNEECFQVFNYHTAFSYLLKKRSCTKFSHIFNLGPKKHQYDFISEIRKTNPKYILNGKAENDQSEKNEFIRYSFISAEKKFPYVAQYISENYVILENFNNWLILHKPE